MYPTLWTLYLSISHRRLRHESLSAIDVDAHALLPSLGPACSIVCDRVRSCARSVPWENDTISVSVENEPDVRDLVDRLQKYHDDVEREFMGQKASLLRPNPSQQPYLL